MAERVHLRDLEIREVTWIDSSGGARWETLQAIRESAIPTITSVGYVLADEPDRVLLVQSLDLHDGREHEEQNGDNYVLIPRPAITGIETLRSAGGPR